MLVEFIPLDFQFIKQTFRALLLRKQEKKDNSVFNTEKLLKETNPRSGLKLSLIKVSIKKLFAIYK